MAMDKPPTYRICTEFSSEQLAFWCYNLKTSHSILRLVIDFSEPSDVVYKLCTLVVALLLVRFLDDNYRAFTIYHQLSIADEKIFNKSLPPDYHFISIKGDFTQK